jgi:tetratricopeptide (TPR) repeat protein
MYVATIVDRQSDFVMFSSSHQYTLLLLLLFYPRHTTTNNKDIMDTSPKTNRKNMDHFLHCAAKLNNAAILALTAGKRQKALDLFRNALEMLADQDDTMDAVLLVHECTTFPALFDTFLPFIPVSTPDSFIPFNSGSEAFTYSKAFFFNPSLELDQEYFGSFQAVMMFNMALIFHHVSLCTCDEYEEMALALYNKAIELLDRDNLDDLDYVYIAAQNNKAQIHVARTDDPQDTRRLLDKVGDALRQHLKKKVGAFDDQETDNLFLNVLCQGALVFAPLA